MIPACGKQKQEDSVLVYELGKWVKTKPDNLSLTSKTYTIEGTRGDVSTTEVKMEIQSTCDRTGDSQCVGIPVKLHDLYDQHPLSLWIAELHPNH